MIRLDRLCLNLPGFALQDIDLRIGDGEYFVLVGPYASGKTLLLETIAGLRKASSGEIWVDGRNVTRLEPERRKIGMVYQHSALFPHLSVRGNLAFGLAVRRLPATTIAAAVDRAAELLGIGQLLNRSPEHLSGGERQKVALARALATEPDVLLLDEPLAALDPQSREQVRLDLAGLQRRVGMTTIHVTHDFEEATMMGDRIGVMDHGTIRQVGTPDDIFRHPNSEFVARFTMSINVLRGAVDRADPAAPVFVAEGIRLAVDPHGADPGACGAAIRPESILITRSAPLAGSDNVFAATVSRITNKGSIVEVVADVPPNLTCLLTRYGFDQLGLTIGTRVYLTIPRSAVCILGKEQSTSHAISRA